MDVVMMWICFCEEIKRSVLSMDFSLCCKDSPKLSNDNFDIFVQSVIYVS